MNSNEFETNICQVEDRGEKTKQNKKFKKNHRQIDIKSFKKMKEEKKMKKNINFVTVIIIE